MSSFESKSFAIAGFGSGFADRQRDLFASLDAAEKERGEKVSHQSSASTLNIVKLEVDSARQCQKRNVPMKSFLGKESIFKRPEMLPPRRARQSVPDHQRNPHKWTKYSLGDVSPQDMSERSNTVTALSFLRELQARKDRMDVDESPNKPVKFKSSRQRSRSDGNSSPSSSGPISTGTSEEAERPSFYRSKMVMPEYVVGQKKIVKKRPGKASQNTENDVKKKIVLGHLDDEESE